MDTAHAVRVTDGLTDRTMVVTFQKRIHNKIF